MIADAITSALNDVWANIWAAVGPYITLSFLDPFYGWLAWGVIAAMIVSAFVWFFGGWLPALRAIGGVIVLLITFGLFAYRQGEKDARAHDKKWRRR